MQILLSRTQAGPGRPGKQEQEQTSRNHTLANLCTKTQPLFSCQQEVGNYLMCHLVLRVKCTPATTTVLRQWKVGYVQPGS